VENSGNLGLGKNINEHPKKEAYKKEYQPRPWQLTEHTGSPTTNRNMKRVLGRESGALPPAKAKPAKKLGGRKKTVLGPAP